jgi:serine/threonine-protein kinase
MGLFDSLKTALAGKCDIDRRFERLREAISGTMSEFYMARDRKTDKVVGLKILDAEKTAFFESRFKGLKKPSEGEIAKSLSHPNIVQTMEYGLTTKGQQYLVMEFLDGPGLNSVIIERNPLLVGKSLNLIRQMAESIQAVHEAGFIHRDICPRNFVCSADLAQLKLIDFGLTVPATAEFMAPGNRTGTPNYMAPELVKRHKTDQRLDVFSFGITAYELLTFDLPWTRGTDGRAAMGHAAHEAVDILERRPKLNPHLAKAIMFCVERLPDKRCPSMEHFLKLTRRVEREDATK